MCIYPFSISVFNLFTLSQLSKEPKYKKISSKFQGVLS